MNSLGGQQRKRVRTLIVDDAEVMRRAMESLLGFCETAELVAMASSGTEALQYCELLHPDLALADYDLPDMTGLELAQALKTLSPATEVVITSVDDLRHLGLVPILIGQYTFIPKVRLPRDLPDELDRLLRKIEKEESVKL